MGGQPKRIWNRSILREDKKQGLCRMYKKNPCFFVYKVKIIDVQLTNRIRGNIIKTWNAFHKNKHKMHK